MIELVFKSSKGNPVTNSLIIGEIFEKEHNKVIRDIENLSCSDKFRAANFGVSSYMSIQNKKLPMCIMTKDGFSFLVMGYTGVKAGEFKESFIEAFNKMELERKQPTFVIPQSLSEALMLASNQAKEIELKDKQLAIQAHIVDFANRVIDTDNMVDIGQAAKLLKLSIGRNKFFSELRTRGVFFKNRNEPKQEYIERGYFELKAKEIKPNEHPSFSVTKILVTQKGLFWLSKMYGSDYNNSLPKLNAI